MFHSTTILAVRHRGQSVLAGDGQVTFGQTVVKQSAKKIRRLYNDRILAGFAGSAADSFALFARFESKLEQYRGNLERSVVELAKDWRSDRILRRLEAMLIVLDANSTFLLSGNGDLIEPDDGIVAIGSGGPYALSAARRLRRTPSSTPGRSRRSRCRLPAISASTRTRTSCSKSCSACRSCCPTTRTRPPDVADAAPDRRRTRQVRRRPGGGQARRRHRPAQPDAPPEAVARAGRGDRAEEHPDDRSDRCRARPRSPAGWRAWRSRRSSRSKPRSSPRSATSAATSSRWCATWSNSPSTWSAASGSRKCAGRRGENAEERMLDLLLPPSRPLDARTKRPPGAISGSHTRERFREQLRDGRLDKRIGRDRGAREVVPVTRDHRRFVSRGGRTST